MEVLDVELRKKINKAEVKEMVKNRDNANPVQTIAVPDLKHYITRHDLQEMLKQKVQGMILCESLYGSEWVFV